MSKNRKMLIGILAAVLFAAVLIVTGYIFSTSAGQKGKRGGALLHLERSDWNDEVKAAVNDLIDMYAPGAATPSDTTYAVFDFDNTCSIFDIEEQTAVYQLQTMAFEIEPDRMKEVLITGIPDPDEDLTACGISGSFNDFAEDAASAYSMLWDRYGPFTSEGVSPETAKELSEDPYWNEFAVKIITMYDSIGSVCFNRATRGVTEGGGLIAELSVYQRDTLEYDLAEANSAGNISAAIRRRKYI